MKIVTNNSIRSNYLSWGNYPQGNYAHTCNTFLNDCQGDQFRFQASTKSWSLDLGLLEYQFRSYSPTLGRWHPKDPIQEQCGINLYNFVNNHPVTNWDVYGLNGVQLDNYEARFRDLIKDSRDTGYSVVADMLEYFFSIRLFFGDSSDFSWGDCTGGGRGIRQEVILHLEHDAIRSPSSGR